MHIKDIEFTLIRFFFILMQPLSLKKKGPLIGPFHQVFVKKITLQEAEPSD